MKIKRKDVSIIISLTLDNNCILNTLVSAIGRWFSTMKLNDDEEDKEQLVDKQNKTRAVIRLNICLYL